MRRLWKGQVLIEFALAAAGIVAIAFVGARVVGWLNQSMVQRNAAFQQSRAAAAHWPGYVQVWHTKPAGPDPIVLLGRRAGSTPQVTSPGPRSYNTNCPAAQPLIFGPNGAVAKRLQALAILSPGASWNPSDPNTGLTEQKAIVWHHNFARHLVKEANELMWDAIRIKILDFQIAAAFARILQINGELNAPANFSDPGSCGLTSCTGCGDATCTGGVSTCLAAINARIQHYTTALGMIAFCNTPACNAARTCWTIEKSHLTSLKPGLTTTKTTLEGERTDLQQDIAGWNAQKTAIGQRWGTTNADTLARMAINRLDRADWGGPLTPQNGRIPSSVLQGIRQWFSWFPSQIPNHVRPGEYGKLRQQIDKMKDYAHKVQTLILEAEQKEAEARTKCLSDPD